MEGINWLNFLGPIIVAFLMSIPGWIALFRAAQKDKAEIDTKKAEAGKLIQEAALSLLQPFQEQVEVLTGKVCELEITVKELTEERILLEETNKQLEIRVEELERGVDILVAQLKTAGLSPNWIRNGGQKTP